jgi:hypothetical protein
MVEVNAYVSTIDGSIKLQLPIVTLVEVAAIEEGIKAVSKSQQPFNHLSIFSDSTSAIARVTHNKTGPGQS